MKTAVIYARYSCEKQTEQSIEGQLRVCEEYAKKNDILVLNIYIDRAMSGTNDNRKDFQRMLKESTKREWNYIIVYKIDRFGRNKYEMAVNKKMLKDNGVKLLSATENIPDTPEGIILESLLEGMAEYYSAELSQKLKRGMNECRQKGNFTGGYLLYGYKVENKKVIIVEEQAEIVRYIYKQYSIGTYVKDILQDLKERHIDCNGKPFTRTQIYNMLKNEKYTGVYRYKEEIFTNIYPRIIDQELFEKVRAKTNLNHNGKRSTYVRYLLSKKMICGYCGSHITAETGTARNGTKVRYYKCTGKRRHNGCDKHNISKDTIETLVIESLIKELSKETIINAIVSNVLKIQSQFTNGNRILEMLMKDKKQTEKSLSNIMQAVENGLMNNTTNKRMNELENKIAELEKEILIEKTKATTILTEENIKLFYKKALQLNAEKMINYLVNHIKIYDDKIEITLNSPLNKNSETNQGSFLLCKITNTYSIHTRYCYEYKQIEIIIYL